MDSIINNVVCDFEEWPYECAECGGFFSQEEWDNRHSNEDGEDVHSYCCVTCSMHAVERSDENIDWHLLASQAKIIAAFQQRHFSALHNPDLSNCDDLVEIDMLPSEDDAIEGVLNLIEAMLDKVPYFKGE
jgi:hypothetical protein